MVSQIKHQDAKRAHSVQSQIMRYVDSSTAIVLSFLTKNRKIYETKDAKGDQLIPYEVSDEVWDLSEKSDTCAYFIPHSFIDDLISDNIDMIKSPEVIYSAVRSHFEQCRQMLKFKWIHLPVAYVQVVSIMVYSYLILLLLQLQYFPDDESKSSTQTSSGYFMFFIQFILYDGWLTISISMLYVFNDGQKSFGYNLWDIITTIVHQHKEIIDRHYKHKINFSSCYSRTKNANVYSGQVSGIPVVYTAK